MRAGAGGSRKHTERGIDSDTPHPPPLSDMVSMVDEVGELVARASGDVGCLGHGVTSIASKSTCAMLAAAAVAVAMVIRPSGGRRPGGFEYPIQM